MHELEELHGELDVTQAAGAQLDLPPGLRRGQGLFHPAPHGLDVFDEVFPLGGMPDHGGERVDVLLPEFHVPRRGRALSRAWNSHVLAQRS